MNVSSEVSSCASRPIEAMLQTNETKSVADLKTSYTITADKYPTNFEVHVKKIINGEFKKKKSSLKEKLTKNKNALSREVKSHG